MVGFTQHSSSGLQRLLVLIRKSASACLPLAIQILIVLAHPQTTHLLSFFLSIQLIDSHLMQVLSAHKDLDHYVILQGHGNEWSLFAEQTLI